MVEQIMFSSKSDEWATPQKLFDRLNAVFAFDLDPCATPENAKCRLYYTKSDDGLNKSWGGQCAFVNPPYGREIGKWVKKAWEESQKPKTKVVMLLPARTDTAWFHDYIYRQAEIIFIRGRLRFGGQTNGAPFPSMIVIFDRAGGIREWLTGRGTR